MKKILVPTDFSKEAEAAAKVATDFAKKFNYEIHLLHMVDLPTDKVDGIKQYTSEIPEAIYFMKLASKQFEELLNKDFFDGVTVHNSVKTDSTFEGINETAKELDIDLIMMGSQGASGFKEIFVGSNTEKVVRTSDVPVLVIKNTENEFKADNIIFATDFKIESRPSYLKAVEFAKNFDSKIHLLLVNTPNNFTSSSVAKKRIEIFIADTNYTNHTIHTHNDDSIEKGIRNFADEIDADVIGISTHGRQGISHFFNGSIGEDIVNHAVRPVITFKI